MNESIHVALLDEGVAVWRPVPALRIDAAEDRYVLLRPDDFDPDVERWEFPPGSVVEAEARPTAEGLILTAVRAVALDRRTA